MSFLSNRPASKLHINPNIVRRKLFLPTCIVPLQKKKVSSVFKHYSNFQLHFSTHTLFTKIPPCFSSNQSKKSSEIVHLEPFRNWQVRQLFRHVMLSGNLAPKPNLGHPCQNDSPCIRMILLPPAQFLGTVINKLNGKRVNSFVIFNAGMKTHVHIS